MTDPALAATFTEGVDPGLGAIVRRLAAIVDGSPGRMDAAIKWQRLTYAREGDFHHWICGIAVARRAVSLVFHFGGLLDDPDGRFIVGSSRFGRKLEYRIVADVDEDVVRGFVAQAQDRLDYFRQNWQAIQAGAIPARPGS